MTKQRRTLLALFLLFAGLLRQPLLVIQAAGQQSPTHTVTLSSDTAAPRRNTGLFFEKMRAGKTVSVAYVGGSITAGIGASNPEKTSYRALVTDWLRKTHPKATVSELNASLNSTGNLGGSLYATLRARRDVIAHKPDLVIIECAVNDADEDEVIVKKAVEGLLRQLLIVSQPPEVVLLYAGAARRASRAEAHEVMADHYRVPSLDLQPHIWALVDGGKVKAAEFWKDGVNPTDVGHRFYADSLISFLAEQEKQKPSPIARNLPSPLISDELNYGEFKASAEIRHDANWKAETVNDRALPTALLIGEKAGAQLEYFFEGTVLGLSFRTGPDGGMFECLIDGKPAPAPLSKIDTYSGTPQVTTRIIPGGLGPGEHKLTIRVLSEKHAKSTASNVRLGYLLIGGTRPERL